MFNGLFAAWACFLALGSSITIGFVQFYGIWSANGGQWPGSGGGSMVGAPGPVAGVGLPILAAVGAYTWYRARKARKDAGEL